MFLDKYMYVLLYFKILDDDFADIMTYTKFENISFIFEPKGMKEVKIEEENTHYIFFVIVMNFIKF